MNKKSATVFLALFLTSSIGSARAGEIPLGQDLFEEMSEFLPVEDLKSLRQVSRETQKKADQYCEKLSRSLISSTVSPSDIDLSTLASYQSKIMPKLSPTLKISLVNEIDNKIGKANKCAFVLKGSPLTPYMQETLVGTEKSHIRLEGYTLYQKYKDSLNSRLFIKDVSDSFKAAVAQHLLNRIDLYAPKNSGEEALDCLWQVNESRFVSYLKKIFIENQCIEFSGQLMPEQLTIDHHLVITDTQMADLKNKGILTKILQNNPNHKVVLDVGQVFVQNEVLALDTQQIPDNLVHLIITNTSGNVTSIGDYFLEGFPNQEIAVQEVQQIIKGNSKDSAKPD